MKEYHKIQTVFKRDPETNFKTLLMGEYSLPEFELLKDIQWGWTEKVDGTNIRIMWDNPWTIIGGKTDRATIPTFLEKALLEIFTTEKMSSIFSETESACLYGEGYGQKIQKGGNYLPDSNSFILFDCRIGPWWMTRETLEDFASRLGIGIVPIIGSGTLAQAVEFAEKGYKSTIAHNTDYDAEGLVLKPRLELLARNANRIISKIKHKDFTK